MKARDAPITQQPKPSRTEAQINDTLQAKLAGLQTLVLQRAQLVERHDAELRRLDVAIADARDEFARATAARDAAAPEWLDEKQLAARTPISRGKWALMRSKAQGPAFYKVGKRCLYQWGEVQAWLASLRVEPKSSTPPRSRAPAPAAGMPAPDTARAHETHPALNSGQGLARPGALRHRRRF